MISKNIAKLLTKPGRPLSKAMIAKQMYGFAVDLNK